MKASTVKWLRIFRNKYVLVSMLFLILIFFVDENNLMVTHKLHKRVKALRDEEMELYQDFVADSIKAQTLKHDKGAIERYARETYYMKRANEDIFVIREE
ncbi:MAG: septum formation initiator family protein [Bacteroidales bacterium]|nr:septum formation initiator family protein [Bacteroidales bacterium]